MLTELRSKVDNLESKVDEVVTFTGQLRSLLTAWFSGGKGKLLSGLARLHGGGS